MSANRVLVHQNIFDRFVDRYVAKVSSLTVGDPGQATTVIGPLINAAQAEKLNRLVDEAVEQGARPVLRGTVGGGLFEPVVLVDAKPEMRVAQTELFGPVVYMIPFGSDDEAVTIANDSTFGLSGAVRTGDLNGGNELAKRVQTGMIHVNDATMHDEPIVAFGGEKQSGVGRLNGAWSLGEFTTFNGCPSTTAVGSSPTELSLSLRR